MAEVKLTKAQQAVVENRGGALLVSAAAGSGKTAVLVERVLQKICDESAPCDADRLLIATFSNLAANELFGGPVEFTEENAATLAEKTADKITVDLFRLRENCGHLVLVTNDIFADRDGETTLVQTYKQVLGTVNCRMAAAADTVIEVTAGIADVWKGAERRSADYECVE